MKLLANFLRKQLFVDFSLPELQSLCEMKNVHLNLDYEKFNPQDDWVHYIDISIETAKFICSRSIMTKNIVQIFSEASNYEDLVDKASKNEEFLKEIDDLTTFKFIVDSKGKSYDMQEKINIINKFQCFDFKAKVDLKKAERNFIIIDNSLKNLIYFGKIVAGDSNESTNYYSKFNLSNRLYLGPTSTDNELGFLMANLAQVEKNQIIYDPFVGTGSLLIPPSYFGCKTFGSDIDIRVLRGYGVGYSKKTKKNDKSLDIFTNFEIYKFNKPEILRFDINNPVFRNHEIFDAIICDPPYGHRAFSRKIDPKSKEENLKIKNENDQNKNKILEEVKKIEDDDSSSSEKEISETRNKDAPYFTPLLQCSKENIYENLLNLGSKVIKKNGLLVCLFPFKKTIESMTPVFPINQNFDLIRKCENPYSEKKSRFCLVYRKK